jgi:hypothetical protein
MIVAKKNGRMVYSVVVSGKWYHTTIETPFEFESLADAGWIRVTHCGDENCYFDFKDDGGEEHTGYCKCF